MSLRSRLISAIFALMMLSIITVPVTAETSLDLSEPLFVLDDMSLYDYDTMKVSDDGKIIAMHSQSEQRLTIIDVEAHEILWDYWSTSTTGEDGGVGLSGDGSHVLYVDGGGRARYFDVRSGNETLWTYDGVRNPSIAINQDGSRVVIGSQGKVLLFDDEILMSSYVTTSSDYFRVCASGTGDMIVAALNNELFLFDGNLSQITVPNTFESMDSIIIGLMISDDGKRFCYYDQLGGTLMVCVDFGGVWLKSRYDYQDIYYADFSADGSTIIVVRPTGIVMKDIITDTDTWTSDIGRMVNPSISGDGSLVAMNDMNFLKARLYGKYGPTPIDETPVDTAIYSELSKDGRTLVCLTYNDQFIGKLTVYSVVDEVVTEDDGLVEKVEQAQLWSMLAMVTGLVSIALLAFLIIRGRKG